MQWHHLTHLIVITSAVTGFFFFTWCTKCYMVVADETDEEAAAAGCSEGPEVLLGSVEAAFWTRSDGYWTCSSGENHLTGAKVRRVFAAGSLSKGPLSVSGCWKETNKSRDGWEQAADVNETFWKCYLKMHDYILTRIGLLRPIQILTFVCFYQPSVQFLKH